MIFCHHRHRLWAVAVGSAFASPSVYKLKRVPRCDGFRPWAPWEVLRSRGWSPMTGVAALREETSSSLPPSEVGMRKLSSWRK